MDNEQYFEGKGIAIAVGEPTKERRRHRRTKLPSGLQVAWHTTRGVFVSDVSDLGLGGAFIVTPEPPPVSASLKLLFDAPGKELQACAIVRRSLSGQGMGVEFVKMESADWARLQDLLKNSIVSKSLAETVEHNDESSELPPETVRQATTIAKSSDSVTARRIRGADRRAQLRSKFPASTEIIKAESGECTEASLDDLGQGDGTTTNGAAGPSTPAGNGKAGGQEAQSIGARTDRRSDRR